MNARHSLRSSRILSAFVLIALVLVGRFAESFHSAQAGHTICPEHGELLHVADVHVHADARADESASGALVRPIETHADHEHCLLATLLWSSGATWMPVETHAVVTAVESDDLTLRVECACFALPPLSFAPKHSPPARVV